MTLRKKWIIAFLLYFPAYFLIDWMVSQFFGFVPWFFHGYIISIVGSFISKNLIFFMFYLIIFTAVEQLNNAGGATNMPFFQKKRNLLITALVTLATNIAGNLFIGFIGRLLLNIIPLDYIIIPVDFVLESVLWVFAFVAIYAMTAETPVSLSGCMRQLFCSKRSFISLGMIVLAIVFFSVKQVRWLNNISITDSFLDMVDTLSPPDYSPGLFRWVNLGCIVAVGKMFGDVQGE